MKDNGMTIIKDGGICSPIGFKSSAISAGIKNNSKKDLCILLSDSPAEVAATFTKNKVIAAPVRICKKIIKNSNKINGIIVNSGNANACTGKKGLKDCEYIINYYENKFNLPTNTLLIASTGVIGEYLPKDKFIDGLGELKSNLQKDSSGFAEAILTTDKFTKKLALSIDTGHGKYTIGSTAKGAGMIAPNMATMLAFITTDAKIDPQSMKKYLKKAVNNSFNIITVDGDMSTNDSVFLFSNGCSKIKIKSKKDKVIFINALTFLCLELAKMIVKDGEGATKCVKIIVKNALSRKDADKCAFKIAQSTLVKTMFFGEEPNWGRIIAAAGASRVSFNPEKTDIYFDKILYVKNGQQIKSELEKEVHKIMKKNEYAITIDLKSGSYSHSLFTSDLTHEYIKINSSYKT